MLIRTDLVDAVVLDLAAGEAAIDAARLAQDVPSTAFIAATALRAQDASLLGRAAEAGVVELLVDGVDEVAVHSLLAPLMFTNRFAAAFAEPPPTLALTHPLQRDAWRALIGTGGRRVGTERLATAAGMTREHLSRTFSAGDAPNLKRVIDLVRLLAAAELSKNPGYDVADVARVLSFSSPSHLASTAQRVVGTRPASLSRLRAIDLIDRFAQGRRRSRG